MPATPAPDDPRGAPSTAAPAAPARWFLACWPDAATRRALQAHQAAWHWPPQARPTPPARLHLTLHFLGPLAGEAVAALRQALDGIGAPPPVVWTLDRPASWPGGVAVLEPRAVPAAARTLHAALAAVLHGQGLTVERRPWRPHVTLARRAGGAPLPAAPAPLHWTSRGFELVRADPAYHRVARWPVAAAGAAPAARRSGAGRR
jgi:RNA 2',3'-cyclic 3'-phosphodiesterase